MSLRSTRPSKTEGLVDTFVGTVAEAKAEKDCDTLSHVMVQANVDLLTSIIEEKAPKTLLHFIGCFGNTTITSVATGKHAERIKQHLRYLICFSAIAQGSCLICTCSQQLTFVCCCQISLKS